MTKKLQIVAYLDEDLVKEIDKYLENKPEYRSRGHFIEVLLRQAIK